MAVDWIKTNERGIYCEPGDFYIDPWLPVAYAILTHGHADHARPNNKKVLATADTIDIMQHRYRENSGESFQKIKYAEKVRIKDLTVSLYPAGHILGSAQVLMEYRGQRVVVSGDYKRRHDPTCEQFEPIKCHTFITEATFGIPIFTHPSDTVELTKLLHSMTKNPHRPHLVGCYALGKCQRLIIRLRQMGYTKTIYVHGALLGLIELYGQKGFDFGNIVLLSQAPKNELNGELILCPPSALNDRWSRKFQDPIIGLASGWMRILQRAKQKGIELPLIISDHADWPELIQTLHEVSPQQLLVTHGQEDALVYYAHSKGYEAKALSLHSLEMEAE